MLDAGVARRLLLVRVILSTTSQQWLLSPLSIVNLLDVCVYHMSLWPTLSKFVYLSDYIELLIYRDLNYTTALQS